MKWLHPSEIKPEVLDGLSVAVGSENLSIASTDRFANARDCWPRDTMHLKEGFEPKPPDVVIWPRSTAQVIDVIRIALKHNIPVVPYGGGAGVCAAATPISGGISLDMKRMNRLCAVDEISCTATVEPGIVGQVLEELLNRRGYTLGHFPSSIYCSTFGGFLAGRSAGQLSTKYGKIEDMVVSMKVVTGRGELIETRSVPRSATGPDWDQLFMGSEGTLGVITEAMVRVHPYPEERRFRGLKFPDVPTGLKAIRNILQQGLRPAVVRLYDEFDTAIVGSKGGPREARNSVPWGLTRWVQDALKQFKRGATGQILKIPKVLNALADMIPAGCLMILGFEGQREIVAFEERSSIDICRQAGGQDLGPGPGEQWLAHRYSVSYKMSKIFDSGAFVDTMEIASTWDKLENMYRQVRAAISPHVFVMAHFSHAYHEGCSIYFTFAGAANNFEAARDAYDAVWRDGLSAAEAAGGTISHHHGVGFSKAAFMKREHGEAMILYRALKQALDPQGILNPGKMGL